MFGHLGHLTSKPQQNRQFFNLSKMANHKTLAILPITVATALRTSASGVYPGIIEQHFGHRDVSA